MKKLFVLVMFLLISISVFGQVRIDVGPGDTKTFMWNHPQNAIDGGFVDQIHYEVYIAPKDTSDRLDLASFIFVGDTLGQTTTNELLDVALAYPEDQYIVGVLAIRVIPDIDTFYSAQLAWSDIEGDAVNPFLLWLFERPGKAQSLTVQ